MANETSWANEKAREVMARNPAAGLAVLVLVESAIRETIAKCALVAGAAEFYATDREVVMRAASHIRKLGEP